LVNRLAAAGVRRIEAVSFVRDDRVPQMAGAEEVVREIERRDGVEYAGLVLNEQGFERFRASGLDRVNVTLGASESFNRRNGNASLTEATDRVQKILAAAEVPTTATISVAFGCPFEGDVDPRRVAELAGRLDADELVLADTIGVATPSAVRSLVKEVGELGRSVGFHGHNTRNTGYANALAALEAGASVLDASIGGLGGCPYAPNATGNIATEDLVYLLAGEGVETRVDPAALIDVSDWLAGVLGRRLEGQLYRAGLPVAGD
jgi:isopropylmalate/homocitrate/citramalate synthase